jgi:glycosyltransferase involved in cell wall biosynthesis
MTERHLITGEYPPASGGVADYTAAIAGGLADAGERVHVWCGGLDGHAEENGIVVHRVLGEFAAADLARLSAALDASAGPRRLLVQWVPHAFGRRALNVGFSRWVRSRALDAADDVDVMVHEPFLPFHGGVRQHAAAAVQRLMTATVIRSARRVWVATPAWADFCRPYARRTPFSWAPVPSGVPVCDSNGGESPLRALGVTPGMPLVGCFGRGGGYQREVLADVARLMRSRRSSARLLLIGAGGDELRAHILAADPALGPHVIATGPVPAAVVSHALRACTAMLQPYADGVCGRHSSVMAALAHGSAIVTTDGRFTEPIWRESNAVLLVRSGARAKLADAIAGLLQDEGERARLSAAAVRLYADRFDVRHTIAALREGA